MILYSRYIIKQNSKRKTVTDYQYSNITEQCKVFCFCYTQCNFWHLNSPMDNNALWYKLCQLISSWIVFDSFSEFYDCCCVVHHFSLWKTVQFVRIFNWPNCIVFDSFWWTFHYIFTFYMMKLLKDTIKQF